MSDEKLIAERIGKRVYREDNKCIKMFDSSFTKADILNEALNLARVEETGLKVPKLLEVTVIDGKWSIVSEFIVGDTLAELMQENPEQIHEYMELFVDLQLQIHSRTSVGLKKLKDVLKRKIGDAPLPATTRYDMCFRTDEMPIRNKVCHGDYNPSNIIITNDDEAYVIDWSHATRGNSGAEAAMTYLYFILRDEKENAELYLDLFCEKNNTDRDYVLRWMPIVAAAQSAKCSEDEFELLKPWIEKTALDAAGGDRS